MTRVHDVYPNDQVSLREVGLRDGLQLVKKFPSTAAKPHWVRDEYAAGVRHFEIGSFLPAKTFPQFADIHELIRTVAALPGAHGTALTLNERGVNEALASGYLPAFDFSLLGMTLSENRFSLFGIMPRIWFYRADQASERYPLNISMASGDGKRAEQRSNASGALKSDRGVSDLDQGAGGGRGLFDEPGQRGILGLHRRLRSARSRGGGVFGLLTSAMIVVILAIAAFGPNVRGKLLDTL